MANKDTTTSNELLAGVGRVIITPPIGIRMMGYTVQERVSESIERELTATALVLGVADAKVIIIACDILFIQNPHVDRIRDRIGQRLGIPADNVLINTSHTHLGPMLPGWQVDDADQQQLQERYLHVLEEALVGVASLAHSQMQPARLGAKIGLASIGINRRERLPDGTVVIGENPEGAVDDDVGVIRVDNLHGKPITTVMTAAAHTIVLGPKTSQLSPDYVGPAREIVESATGAPSLFLQGAAGNVSPRCGIGTGGDDQYDDLERIGTMLAGETLKMWSQIRTHNQHGPRRIVQSVAAISVWDYEPVEDTGIAQFGVRTKKRSLSMAPLPDRASAEANLAKYQQRLEEAHNGGAGRGPIHVAQRLVDWSKLVLKSIDDGSEPITRELQCWTFRIDDIAIAAVNGEPFAELALEIKRRSPIAHTLFLGYSNGCLGYLPTLEAFDEGGMEVNESYQNYMLPVPFTREWGPAVIDTSLGLLDELA